MKYSTVNEVYKKAKNLECKTFGEIDTKGRLDNKGNKGGYGHVIEESHFGYEINSDRNPDFNEAGIEMKVTPFRENRNGSFSAKERLVLNIINFHTEIQKTFIDSDFWRKNEMLLLIFYLYEEELDRADQVIKKVLLYEYPETDFRIIKQDWQTIVDKIRAGKAHELSEADTMYLGACPKGANRATGMVSQPNSDELAMRRACAFKQSYMTKLVRKFVTGDDEDERIITDISDLETYSFENVIRKRLKPFMWISREELKERFDVSGNAKNINEVLLARMLGVSGKLSNTEEFRKANIIPKTIRVNHDGSITESMSFKPFRFEEIVNESWEDSSLRNHFEKTKFLFVIFKYDSDGNLRFRDIKLWNMPLSDLDEHVKKVWFKTKILISEGKIIKRITDKRIYNHFPDKSDNPVAHVRPHAINRQDTYPLPVPDKKTGWTNFTKQSFWLNNYYILRQISDLL